jgi:hypothetical protein
MRSTNNSGDQLSPALQYASGQLLPKLKCEQFYNISHLSCFQDPSVNIYKISEQFGEHSAKYSMNIESILRNNVTQLRNSSIFGQLKKYRHPFFRKIIKVFFHHSTKLLPKVNITTHLTNPNKTPKYDTNQVSPPFCDIFLYVSRYHRPFFRLFWGKCRETFTECRTTFNKCRTAFNQFLDNREENAKDINCTLIL